MVLTARKMLRCRCGCCGLSCMFVRSWKPGVRAIMSAKMLCGFERSDVMLLAPTPVGQQTP